MIERYQRSLKKEFGLPKTPFRPAAKYNSLAHAA
jgi:hypothetical protein